MYLVRDVFQCKPGKVRDLVTKFKTLGEIVKGMGDKSETRILTDVCGPNYWTLVFETTVESIEKHEEMVRKSMSEPRLQDAMRGYHELVESGHREILHIE